MLTLKEMVLITLVVIALCAAAVWFGSNGAPLVGLLCGWMAASIIVAMAWSTFRRH